jgi:hypothetical protein
MQTVFSQRFLAGLRARNAASASFRDDIFQDPDNCGPRLSLTLKETVAEIYALLPARQSKQAGAVPDTGEGSKGYDRR